MIHIDHIFIFTNDKGEIANELIKMGLIEGSSRVHVGQGTSNRKFYFENFFLEILWVHNENEISNNKINETGLLLRSEFYENGFSPFGLCIFNNENSNSIFDNALKYQPDYFPEGMEIEIVNNNENPSLPWTFRLPFKEVNKNTSEPKNHPLGIKKLTGTNFFYREINCNNYIEKFKSDKNIIFSKSEKDWLYLTFDDGVQQKEKTINSLNLTLLY